MGPLVSKEQHDKVMGYIEAGKRDGASVVMGGDVPASDGGYYVNPTILADVNPQMSVVREEIFGPVVVAQRFDELDEVAKMANDTAYGLGASVWTRDVSAMHKLASRIKSGTVWGNCHSVIDTALPFGGYKESGLGREQGQQGFEVYQETKTVIVQL
jgi:phenylacetaldehyde dehydrogenase